MAIVQIFDMITSRHQTQVRKLHGAAWSIRSWDEIIIARMIATGEVADQRFENPRCGSGDHITVHESRESATSLIG